MILYVVIIVQDMYQIVWIFVDLYGVQVIGYVDDVVMELDEKGSLESVDVWCVLCLVMEDVLVGCLGCEEIIMVY